VLEPADQKRALFVQLKVTK